MTRWRIPFASLVPGEDAETITAAITRVVRSGWFVLGPEVEAFEAEFAQAAGASYAVGVGSGTDALALILRALDIGPGDEVITTPLSAAYTALAIMMTGARPVFADINPHRFTIDPEEITGAITERTRALLPVHLYGQAAEMAAIEQIAGRHNVTIVEDCCQAHLAKGAGRAVGTFGIAGAFSFYPTKNLGALGDGGAVLTNDHWLAERIKRLRNGGESAKYHHQEAGVNSRLDEMQAAILRARLPFLSRWTERRRQLAALYRAQLQSAPVAVPPECDPGHVYHLFVVRTGQRATLQRHLVERGIETLVHYPVPIPRQPALAGATAADCPRATAACDEVLSLPLHPALTDADIARVSAAIHDFDQRKQDACVR